MQHGKIARLNRQFQAWCRYYERLMPMAEQYRRNDMGVPELWVCNPGMERAYDRLAHATNRRMVLLVSSKYHQRRKCKVTPPYMQYATRNGRHISDWRIACSCGWESAPANRKAVVHAYAGVHLKKIRWAVKK